LTSKLIKLLIDLNDEIFESDLEEIKSLFKKDRTILAAQYYLYNVDYLKSKYEEKNEKYFDEKLMKHIKAKIKEKYQNMKSYLTVKKYILDNYRHNIEVISPEKPKDKSVDLWLFQIINEIFLRLVLDFKHKPDITEKATIFKSELDLGHNEFIIKSTLSGLHFEREEFQINEHIKYYYGLKGQAPNKPKEDILEIKKQFPNEVGSIIYLNRVLDSIRLFNLNSVYSIEDEVTKISIIDPSSTPIYSERSYSSYFETTIQKSQENDFRNFVNTILQYLEKYESDDELFRSIAIAIERYRWTVLERIPVDRKLMYAIMGFEPLFFSAKENTSSSYQLSLRLTVLLDCFGLADKHTRENITKAYQYRNDVVHGKKYDKEDFNEMEKLFPIISNYLRISIIFFILNKPHRKKQAPSLIKILDKAILDTSSHQEIIELIDENKKKFPMVFT